MTDAFSVIVWLGIAAAALAAWYWIQVSSARARDSAWLPSELKGARLIYAEQSFTISHPLELVARVDRGYVIDGKVHLVELKTRVIHRAYRSDIIELSAQRLAIEQSTGYPVSDTGYVVIQNAKGRERTIHSWVPMKPRAIHQPIIDTGLADLVPIAAA